MAKLKHDREGCIGCGACAALDPDNWEMADDGKSDLKGGTPCSGQEGWFEKDGVDAAKAKEAESNCPADVIHAEE